jgi:uncharacterized protein YjaZ
LLVGCGVKTNGKADLEKQKTINAFFLIESQCSANQSSKSSVYFDIQNFYNRALMGKVKILGDWFSESRFHYLHPMVVNEEILKNKLDILEMDFLKGEVKIKDLLEIMEMANRFEGQKCNFNELINKKETDLTSYLNFTHMCAKNFQSECTDDILKKLLTENDEKEIISLCENSKRIYQCKREFEFSKRSKKLGEMANFYLKQVEKDKFQSLFNLRENHARFNCEKQVDSTWLKLRAINDGFDDDLFQAIVKNIERVWSKNSLKVAIEIVDPGMDYDLKIAAIQNQISHVNNNDLSTMYLDKNLDRTSIVNVAAHEFGHNIGFPDCYIEFFDTVKNALVYYELSPDSRNIMCSLKVGYQVEDMYIDQIIQKTCKFQSN